MDIRTKNRVFALTMDDKETCILLNLMNFGIYNMIEGKEKMIAKQMIIELENR